MADVEGVDAGGHGDDEFGVCELSEFFAEAVCFIAENEEGSFCGGDLVQFNCFVAEDGGVNSESGFAFEPVDVFQGLGDFSNFEGEEIAHGGPHDTSAVRVGSAGADENADDAEGCGESHDCAEILGRIESRTPNEAFAFVTNQVVQRSVRGALSAGQNACMKVVAD